MLINERHNLIILELQKNPNITVREMASKLNFSEPTIRRDYTELARRGIITKVYGGVILNRIAGAADREIPFILRENERSKPKEKMGMLASKYIRDGMVIMLDGSTSAYHLVPCLSKFKDIIVVTSGAKTAVALAELHIPVFCTGGKMRTNSFSYIGKEAEDAVRKYNADIMFFSCHGVNDKGMLTDPSLPETQIRKVAMNQSKKTVFLCDETKISLSTPYNLVSIQTVDHVITNSALVHRYFQTEEKGQIIIA